MKMNFGKKLVLFLHWLLSLLICALAVGLLFWNEKVNELLRTLDQLIGSWGDIVAIAAAAVYALLAILSVAFIFSNPSKRSERGFITVDSSEAGRTRIAVGAVEQMIRQAVRSVDGIAEMKSNIVNGEDSIAINTVVTIAGGAHVPTVTMNIQRAVRSYIELNCGVAVREVSVSVNALESGEETGKRGRKKDASAQAPVYQAVPAQQEVPEAALVKEDAAPENDVPASEEAASADEMIEATEISE